MIYPAQEKLKQLRQEGILDEQDRLFKIANHVSQILDLLGQDLLDENLKETPGRVARYLTEFLNWEPGNTDTKFESIETDQMVILSEIPFWSLCSHHLLAFSGTISIGYLTGEHVIGLSKLARIAQKHAHKLQLQERLAHDIADDIEIILKPRGIGVLIKANHSCMQLRGIRSEGTMITSVLRGAFRDDPGVKEEFFTLIKG